MIFPNKPHLSSSSRQWTKNIIRHVKIGDLPVAAQPGVAIAFLAKGDIILNANVYVATAFNSATTDTLNLGTLADGDAYLAAGNIHAVGTVALPLLPRIVQEDTWLYVSRALTGTAATAGEFVLHIEIANPNDKANINEGPESPLDPAN